MSSTSKKEEPKQSLPPGHPQAGYVDPDLSYHEGTGTIPDAEAAWHEERNDAREQQVKAVEDNEHKVATDEAKEREKAQDAGKDKEAKQTSSSSSSKA